MEKELVGTWTHKSENPSEMGEYFCIWHIKTLNETLEKKFIGYFDGDTFVEMMEDFYWLKRENSKYL